MGSDAHVRPHMGAEAMTEEAPGAAGKLSQLWVSNSVADTAPQSWART